MSDQGAQADGDQCAGEHAGSSPASTTVNAVDDREKGGSSGRRARFGRSAVEDRSGSKSKRWVTRPAGRVRRVLGVVIALACLLTAALCALMWCDVLIGNVVPVLQALTPVWVLIAAVMLVAAVLVRRRVALLAALPMLVAATAAGVALAQHPSPPSSVQHAAGQRHLRVLALNLEFGGADARAVAAEVARVRPDVVVMPETTAVKLRLLDAAGLGGRLPYRASGLVDDGSRGTAVLSRYPLHTLDDGRHLGPYDLQMPIVTVAAPGADVTVHGVHTYPPLQDGANQWRPQLEALGRWQRGENAPHLVMAGDFNASAAHPAFRHLADGLIDAFPARHGNWPPTWPQDAVVPPFAQIDHILTRGFVPVDAGTFTVPGTDHAGVWSDLRY